MLLNQYALKQKKSYKSISLYNGIIIYTYYNHITRNPRVLSINTLNLMGMVNALPSLVMAVNTPSRTTKMMIKRDPELAAACPLRLTLWRRLTLCALPGLLSTVYTLLVNWFWYQNGWIMNTE